MVMNTMKIDLEKNRWPDDTTIKPLHKDLIRYGRIVFSRDFIDERGYVTDRYIVYSPNGDGYEYIYRDTMVNGELYEVRQV